MEKSKTVPCPSIQEIEASDEKPQQGISEDEV